MSLPFKLGGGGVEEIWRSTRVLALAIFLSGEGDWDPNRVQILHSQIFLSSYL